jgi:hypothetical protein
LKFWTALHELDCAKDFREFNELSLSFNRRSRVQTTIPDQSSSFPHQLFCHLAFSWYGFLVYLSHPQKEFAMKTQLLRRHASQLALVFLASLDQREQLRAFRQHRRKRAGDNISKFGVPRGSTFTECMVRRPTARRDCWTKYSLRKCIPPLALTP